MNEGSSHRTMNEVTVIVLSMKPMKVDSCDDIHSGILHHLRPIVEVVLIILFNQSREDAEISDE